MIVDSHCHLHDPAFTDLPSALGRALQCDVWGVVAVGCDPASNRKTLQSAQAFPKAVWPAIGFHPDWPQLGEVELTEVEAQLAAHHPRIVALGEVGLPWYSLDGAADGAERMRRGEPGSVASSASPPTTTSRSSSTLPMARRGPPSNCFEGPGSSAQCFTGTRRPSR